jgi:hypothetical protein
VSKTSPKGPVDRGSKTTDSKSVGPINLTRPDDGYGNLRRRAARPSLIAAQKKPQTVTSASSMVDHPRNAAGAVVPAMSAPPAGFGAAKPGPGHAEPAAAIAFGAARNSLGLSATGVHPVRPRRPSRRSPESTAPAYTPSGSVSEDRRRITRPSPARRIGTSEHRQK